MTLKIEGLQEINVPGQMEMRNPIDKLNANGVGGVKGPGDCPLPGEDSPETTDHGDDTGGGHGFTG